MTNRDKDVIRALACVMWADGNASPKEREFLEQLVAAYEPGSEERREIVSWLERDCSTLADVQLEKLTVEDRELLLTDAALLARADDVVLPSEGSVLEKLGQRLGFSPEDVTRIVSNALDDTAISLPSSLLEDRKSVVD
jgi:tellurite resistance protein